MITVRRADISDLEAMEILLYPHYFEESGYKNLTYSPTGTRKIIRQYLNQVTYLAFQDDELAGFGSMDVGRTFYEEVEADCDMFFVLPKFRGTGVSRKLVEALVQGARDAGATVLYSCGQSGIGEKNNVLWENLWKKYGFTTLGKVMINMELDNG